MPTIDIPDDELAAVTAAIRGVIAGGRYPHALALIRSARRWRGSRQPQSQRNLIAQFRSRARRGPAAGQGRQAGEAVAKEA